MIKTIAETAWHHQGDFSFFKKLITTLLESTHADYIKLHITLDLDEYMDSTHDIYLNLKAWLFNEIQWREILDLISNSEKGLMVLCNDRKAINLASEYNADIIELHAVCINDIFLINAVNQSISDKTIFMIGVGGNNIYEIDYVVNNINTENIVLMFGFQNYPTVYEDVNFSRMRKIMSIYNKYDYGYADHTSWDEPNNEIITIMGAAIGVSYIEKHVTTEYGLKRADWHAAINVNMFNSLCEQLKILDSCNGNGVLQPNINELKSCIYGPLKKAGIFNQDLSPGTVFSEDMVVLKRVNEISNLSQLDIINLFGKKLSSHVKHGDLVDYMCF